MENAEELSQEQLNLIIVEGDDIFEISAKEVVISEGGKCRRILYSYALQQHHRCLETEKMW
jgi:hypothetical protein